MQLEKDVERYLREKVKALGGRCIKLSSQHEEGLPDRMILLPGGKVFFVELKRVGGKLSAMQKLQHESLRRLGQRVYVPYKKMDVDEILYVEGGDAQ